MRSRIEKILISWDTFFSLLAMLIACLVTPNCLDNKFCYSIYEMAITILAIIFSIFFASLTVIMAFPDNEFISVIENDEKKLFTQLIGFFKDTLFALFISLLYTIILYVFSLYYGDTASGNRILFISFIGIFIYSLVATIIAVNVTLSITTSRAKFLANKYSSLHNEKENQQ